MKNTSKSITSDRHSFGQLSHLKHYTKKNKLMNPQRSPVNKTFYQRFTLGIPVLIIDKKRKKMCYAS